MLRKLSRARRLALRAAQQETLAKADWFHSEGLARLSGGLTNRQNPSTITMSASATVIRIALAV